MSYRRNPALCNRKRYKLENKDKDIKECRKAAKCSLDGEDDTATMSYLAKITLPKKITYPKTYPKK